MDKKEKSKIEVPAAMKSIRVMCDDKLQLGTDVPADRAENIKESIISDLEKASENAFVCISSYVDKNNKSLSVRAGRVIAVVLVSDPVEKRSNLALPDKRVRGLGVMQA